MTSLSALSLKGYVYRQSGRILLVLCMKDIKGFEGLYAVTREGRIWSHEKTWAAGNYKNEGEHPAHWLAPYISKSTGYPRVNLSKNRKSYVFYVHRLVAMTFIPNPNNFPIVNHKDCDKTNNTVENLEWCTSEYNAKHAALNERLPRGSDNHASKLTVEDIVNIRARAKKGISCRQLAREYGVAYSTTTRIVNRVVWAWVI